MYILDLFDQATKAEKKEAFKIFFELLKNIATLNEDETLSLWQAYKSLGIKKSRAGQEFEKSILSRLTAILFENKATEEQYSGYSSIYSKEKSIAESRTKSLKLRIEIVTGLKVEYDFSIKKRSLLEKLFR